MIFYDEKNRRKAYVRVGAIALLVLLIVLAVSTVRGIYNDVRTPPISPSRLYYAYDYYFESAENNSENKVVLTFDDGPHPIYTDKILDTLVRKGAPATFFFIGENVVEYKDAAGRTAALGYEIGNHSYTHSENVHASKRRLTWELQVTDKVITEVTGVSPVLYRPPFLKGIGIDPTLNPYVSVPEELIKVTREGYIPVGADIDPRDWKAESPEAVVENTLRELNENPDGKLILLHGEEATVKALPLLIDSLRAEGYTLSTVSDVLGVDLSVIRGKEMPMFGRYGFVNEVFLSTVLSLRPIFASVFGFVLLLLILRVAFLLILLVAGKLRARGTALKKWKGLVSIVIPAYNEAENIAATIESVATNSFPRKEIIVVDDGSVDKTAGIVRDAGVRFPGMIRLIQTENSGKAAALNRGFTEAKGEVVVALDGDTVFSHDTISLLARHFNDPSVGAVAGKMEVDRPRNPLEVFQAIEYTTGQNIERAALSVFSVVSVVPGAVGAWRKEATRGAGGHATNTFVEDQDMTLALLQGGWNIRYEPAASAYTEVPHTMGDFLKQRFRWVFGTMQCFWKYRQSILSFKKARLGWIILPNTLIYSILIPLFAPLVDIFVLWSIFFGSGGGAIVASYVFFLLFDFAYAMVAYYNEPRQQHLLLVPLQRIFYRYAMYYIIIKGLVKAIEGTRTSWNKVSKNGRGIILNVGRRRSAEKRYAGKEKYAGGLT